MEQTKTCKKCGKTFPATNEYFHTQKSNKDGLRKECKKCRADYDKIQRKSSTSLITKTVFSN